MTLASSLFDLLDSNAIVVLIAVIFAAIKAFLERGKQEVETVDETDYDPIQDYEAELERQREEYEIPEPPAPVPPPLSGFDEPPSLVTEPVRPQLSEAEKKALASLNSRPKPKRKSSKQSTKARVYGHLSSPTAAREALLLSEVLGPPKALQDDS